MNITTNRAFCFSSLTSKIGQVYSEKALSEICLASDSSLFWKWSTESSSRLFPFKQEMEKICFKCRELKPLSDYYVHRQMAGGHLNKCKSCTKKDAQNTRNSNLDYYRQYDRDRARLPHRRLTSHRVTREYAATFPHRKKANSAVGNAIRSGRLKKQPCEVCGNPKSHGHHDDYTKPLDVIWLCSIHHKQRHKEIQIKE